MAHVWVNDNAVIKLLDMADSHSCRQGTVTTTVSQLVKVFGEPTVSLVPDTYDSQSGSNVLRSLSGAEFRTAYFTYGWCFKTVRGVFMVRDYWWNRDDEWSIAAEVNDRKTILWAKAYLRAKGLSVK